MLVADGGPKMQPMSPPGAGSSLRARWLEEERPVSLRRFVWLLVVATAGCNGPILLLPGGQLNGDVMPARSDWAFAGETGTVQLETRPEDPYSVNVAFTVIDGQLYINAGGTETQWVKNIGANPLVRLRMDGVLYDQRAERVTDSAEIAAFGAAWTSQSMFRRDPTELDEVWLYRLVPR